MKRFFTLIIFIFISFLSQAQVAVNCEGVIYSPRGRKLYEKINNGLLYSCMRFPYHYKVKKVEYCQGCVPGKVWMDSTTGLIYVKADTVGSIMFRFYTLKNDTAVDSLLMGYPVIALPNPSVKFYSVHQDYIEQSEISKLDKLVCVTKNLDYFVNYEIKKYTVTVLNNNNTIYTFQIIGNMLSGDALSDISKCTSKTKIIIYDIEATRLMDGKTIYPEPKTIVIK